MVLGNILKKCITLSNFLIQIEQNYVLSSWRFKNISIVPMYNNQPGPNLFAPKALKIPSMVCSFCYLFIVFILFAF